MKTASIELPQGFSSISEFPRLKENLHNFINIGDNRIVSRQGVSSVANTGQGACRGTAKFQDELYQVSGTKLIKMDSAYAITDISTAQALDISGTAETVSAVGFTHLVVIVKGDRGYAWDGTTLSEITDPDFVASNDCTFINAKWVFVPSDGGPAFVSDPLDPTVIPANGFFDAEVQPDKNVGCDNFKNRLLIFGEDTTEVFRDTGSGSQPFSRVDGATIPVGLVSGKTHYTMPDGQETILFLGKDNDQAYGIFAIGSGAAPKVSNEAVDELLNDEYTLEELQTCTCQAFNWNKKNIACFRLPRHTLYYVEGRWGFFTSPVTAIERSTLDQDFKAWRVNYIQHCYGKYFCGDSVTDDIGMLDKTVHSDYGEAIEYLAYTFMAFPRGSYFTIASAELDGLAGEASPAAKIGLSMSDDGFVYGPRYYIEMGKIGERRHRVCWELPGGLGSYENYAGFLFQSNAAVELAQKGLTVVYQ